MTKTLQKPNKTDAYNKVVATIKSCTTHNQLDVAEKMMDNFNRMFGMTISLEILLTNQLHQIHLRRIENAAS
jgi:hypothetical protein